MQQRTDDHAADRENLAWLTGEMTEALAKMEEQRQVIEHQRGLLTSCMTPLLLLGDLAADIGTLHKIPGLPRLLRQVEEAIQ